MEILPADVKISPRKNATSIVSQCVSAENAFLYLVPSLNRTISNKGNGIRRGHARADTTKYTPSSLAGPA